MSDFLKILVGDCRQTLQALPESSVHCVVTSPPYWDLRDYGVDPGVWGGRPKCRHKWRRNKCSRCKAWRGCLGLEPKPEMFVAHMVEVFREVWRVLRPDGTCWVNLGDTYVGGGSGGGGSYSTDNRNYLMLKSRNARKRNKSGLKLKDMAGMPWRVALALQADGWYLRSDIVWSKPNPMPESCTDRPTKSHEYIFLLTKSPRYFYDMEAIREPVSIATVKRLAQPNLENQIGSNRVIGKTNGNMKAVGTASYRNRRSVWQFSTPTFSDAHFATFPEELAKLCVLAGTSAHGVCSACGAPYTRLIEKGQPDIDHQRACGGDLNGEYHGTAKKDFEANGVQDASAVKARILAGMVERKTVGWKATCECNAPTTRATVLDIFGGSGTTAKVALDLGRFAIACEMNPNYVEMINRRCNTTIGLNL